MLSTVLVAAVCLAIAAYIIRDFRKDPAPETGVLVEPVGKLFPAQFTLPVARPSQGACIAARNVALMKFGAAKGYEFDYGTLGDPNDNTSKANTVLGGGTPFGGIYLSGNIRIVLDERGQCTPESYIQIFSEDKHAITGGVELNGKIGMAAPTLGVSIGGVMTPTSVRGIVAESNMDIRLIATDPYYSRLSPEDLRGLTGNLYDEQAGMRLEYVHGVFNMG
jgi:hypothetical protein